MNAVKDLNNETLFTFTVDDVKQNLEEPKYFPSPEALLQERTERGLKFEDFSHKNDNTPRMIYSDKNGLMAAVHYAYVNHYPLKISVSDFILMIGQGLAAHLEVHAEDVRPHFVDFEGKETITIERFDFVMGAGNDYSTIFGEFAEKIRERVKTDLYDIMIDDTSVATKLSRIASEIAIMDTFKSYFIYATKMGCGITKVTLVGSSSDWKRLRSKVRNLVEMNKGDRLKLNWWLEKLVPVVEKIVYQAISRKIDKSFWSEMYQSPAKEKGPYKPTPLISGWLNVFNPYIMEKELGERTNSFTRSGVSKPTRSTFDKIHPDTLISGVSKVPLIIYDLSTDIKYPMKIYGGFLGAQMLKDRTIETVYFYAIAHDKEEKEKNGRKKIKL